MSDTMDLETYADGENGTDMAEPLGPYDLTLDEALNRAISVITRDFPPDDKPDLDGVKSVVLKKGKNVTKVAKYWGIRSRNTGEHKYNNLNLISLRRTKARGWEFEPEHSITIDDNAGDDSISRLFTFLATLPQTSKQGKYVVLSSDDLDSRLEQILQAVSHSDQIVELMSQILAWVNADKKASYGLIKLASDDPVRSKSLVAALNYGRYLRALNEFKALVDQNLLERKYQAFLEQQVWMFGSEYSELLPKRTLTVGIQLDFPLRRTVDGFLEVIEIKRPLNDEPLFSQDRSHPKVMKRNPKITEAVDQAATYLSLLDADQYRLKAEDGLLVEKIRAKVIIGRDYGDATQIKALRGVNDRDPRVEVITYDQLIRIAERVLAIMAEENPLLIGIESETLSTNDSVELDVPNTSDDIPY